jgi:hypothetical protein
MSAVFNHAIRWEWLDVNPIRMVGQSAKGLGFPSSYPSSSDDSPARRYLKVGFGGAHTESNQRLM